MAFPRASKGQEAKASGLLTMRCLCAARRRSQGAGGRAESPLITAGEFFRINLRVSGSGKLAAVVAARDQLAAAARRRLGG